MSSSSAAELQQKLFKRMGINAPAQNAGNRKQGARLTQQSSRKDQRKAQRVQKKNQRYGRSQPADVKPGVKRPDARIHVKPYPQQPNGILKQRVQRHVPRTREIAINATDEDQAEHMSEEGLGSEDGEIDMDDLDSGEEEGEEDAEMNGNHDDSRNAEVRGASRGVKDKLAQDDAEIDAFERKLGIKKGRKSLPQAFKDDGLDELLGDLGEVSDGSDDESRKRKRDYEEWLSSKRGKVSSHHAHDREFDVGSDTDDRDERDSMEGEDESLSDVSNEGDFEGFESDGEASTQMKKPKENPYVAPTTGRVAKYVPPSLRKAMGTEDEARIRLRKQVQGLINRLTEANLLSIVRSTEELYARNARGDVTEVMADALLAQVCKPESLPDQFFVLTGGFAAAIYKIIGSSFGGHLLRRIVNDFGNEYDKARKDVSEVSGIRKEPSNILTFLSQLYVFEFVSCRIIFDYMERLLGELSEINVELLLRVCRMTGRLLRRDDPLALKHITGVLNGEVAKVGYANISARYKFMVETINDLKNSKPKAKGVDSVIVSEHVLKMRKNLGGLKSQSRRLEGLAPMGMGLEDVEGADTLGKWWLVGASVPAKAENTTQNTNSSRNVDEAELTDNEDMDFVLPDYPKKAQSQGFSTNTQIAIFTALMSASNYEDGYRQFMNLGLKKDDQLEIVKVLVQCVGSEAEYNPYYTLVGKQACSNSRIKFAVQDRLWKIFRGLGESLFGEDADDEETADSERMRDERRISHVARFYASLIMEGILTLTVLKPLNLPEANPWTSTFVSWLFISLLQECRSSKEAKENARVDKIFGGVRGLPVLGAGLSWFLRKKVKKTKLIGERSLKRLEGIISKANTALQGVQSES